MCSTIDNLLFVSQITDKAKKIKDKSNIAFVDLRKAFDGVWSRSLWKNLQNLEISKRFMCICKNLYENTVLKIKILDRQNGYHRLCE